MVNTLYQEITFLSPTLRLTGNCEDDEKYYKSQSILHIPIRESYENILRSNLNFNTWKKIFATSGYQTNEEYGLPYTSNDVEEKIAFNKNMWDLVGGIPQRDPTTKSGISLKLLQTYKVMRRKNY